MSTFLTPPVWYDKNGSLIEMLSGTAMPEGEGRPVTNLAIGRYSEAGTSNQTSVGSGTAVGYHAKADAHSTALGSEAWATSGIAIGFQTTVSGDGIGIGGNVTGNGISIGGNVIGNGIGIKGVVNEGGIGIGGNATRGGIGIGGYGIEGGIGIGGNAAEGGIGIGGNAAKGNIQLGNSSLTYNLTVGNGRMSLNIGSTDQGNWISATSGGISQGLYLVRYDADNYISLVYLMAPIAITDIGGSTHTNDWYFPLATNTTGILYYLKVDTTSSASALSITPVYYNKSTSAFVTMTDGASVKLFKIL